MGFESVATNTDVDLVLLELLKQQRNKSYMNMHEFQHAVNTENERNRSCGKGLRETGKLCITITVHLYTTQPQGVSLEPQTLQNFPGRWQ